MSSGACLTGHPKTFQIDNAEYRSYWLRSKLGICVTKLGVTGAVVEMHHSTILLVGIYETDILCCSYSCCCSSRKGKGKAMVLLRFHCSYQPGKIQCVTALDTLQVCTYCPVHRQSKSCMPMMLGYNHMNTDFCEASRIKATGCLEKATIRQPSDVHFVFLASQYDHLFIPNPGDKDGRTRSTTCDRSSTVYRNFFRICYRHHRAGAGDTCRVGSWIAFGWRQRCICPYPSSPGLTRAKTEARSRHDPG
jgi:hypothetical protein